MMNAQVSGTVAVHGFLSSKYDSSKRSIAASKRL